MALLPASNASYGERAFWEARYAAAAAEEEGRAPPPPGEWFGGLERFGGLLKAELRPGDRLLVLGCGNSALSYDLFQLGYTNITSIDYSEACIRSMKNRYAHCPGLHWAVMDARALAFTDESFDVVLEKGTLDSMMVGERDPWTVSQEAKLLLDQVLMEVSRVLRPVGASSPSLLLSPISASVITPRRAMDGPFDTLCTVTAFTTFSMSW